MKRISKAISLYLAGLLYFVMSMNHSVAEEPTGKPDLDGRVTELLGRMTIEEKIRANVPGQCSGWQHTR